MSLTSLLDGSVDDSLSPAERLSNAFSDWLHDRPRRRRWDFDSVEIALFAITVGVDAHHRRRTRIGLRQLREPGCLDAYRRDNTMGAATDCRRTSRRVLAGVLSEQTLL